MTCQVAVELRPKLQSCHFCIKAEIPPDSFKFKVFKNLICVDNLCEINVDQLSVVPETLSLLSVTGRDISFRIQSNSNIESDVSSPQVDYVPDIQVNQPVNIFCRCCYKSLTTSPVTFGRCLPLPSSNLEAVEMFCHGHINLKPEPKPTDCLYGSFFFQVDESVIEANEGIINCSRCLSWLGKKRKRSVQLWNSTVVFEKQSDSVSAAAQKEFVQIIRNAASSGMNKAILQCDLSQDEKLFILIWIIEKNLILFKSPIGETNLGENSSVQQIVLNQETVIKLLFKFETQINANINSWLKDIYTVNIDISKPVVVEGLKYLEKMSQLIPEKFRQTNDMNVSYVFR